MGITGQGFSRWKFAGRNTLKFSLVLCITAAGLVLTLHDNLPAQPPRHIHPPVPVPSPQPFYHQPPFDTSFYKWSSREVLETFRGKELEVADEKPGYTMAPVKMLEATIFLMPSYGRNIGGYISSYANGNDLEDARKYYSRMNRNPESPAWWIFEQDNVLVLISGKVTEEKAGEYKEALKEMETK